MARLPGKNAARPHSVPPRAKAAKPAETDPKLQELKEQAKDLGTARKALDDAVSMTRGLWISFISLSAYLMVAVGSVTHVDLFLQNPLQLPLVGVKVSLVVFFWLAPILYFIIHNYLVLNLKLMSDNLRAWLERLDVILDGEKIPQERDFIAEAHKLTLPNFFPVQMLASQTSGRNIFMHWTIKISVITTVLIFPVLILFLFQAQFLPYHDLYVTSLQRQLIIADCLILMYVWPLITFIKIRPSLWKRLLTMSGMMMLVLMSAFVAVFPGEANYKNWVNGILKPSREVLFEGPINDVTGEQSSLFSNRLVLPGKDFASLAGQNSARTQPSVSLRGRRLEGAILTRSNLPLADFTGASLQGADLSHANIRQGKFGCGQVNRIGSYADREEQLADCAILAEADLSDANLQGAFFNDAAMQGVNLSGAQLQAASLERADLKGAYLLSTELQGALMSEVQFQGASISHVNFQGAKLNDAVFQGAELRSSDFQGATLVSTNFMGVLPDTDTKWEDAILEHPNLGEPGSITSAQYNDFVEHTLATIFYENTKEQVRERLKQFEPQSNLSEDQYRLKWGQIAKIALPATYNIWEKQWLDPKWQNRIDFIIEMVCSEENAPLMAESLILQSDLPDDGGLEVRLLEGTGPFRPALAGQLLIADRCPGTTGIKPEAQQILRRWAGEKPACVLPLPPKEWTKPTSATNDCFQVSQGSN
jgi:uncharacterized protein YjbI with pentapeptide repeats